MLLTVGLGIVASIALAMLLPPTYRSEGTVLIEQQELPIDLVRSTVTSYADQRVQVISQRVMTTQTLLDVIKKYDLYPDERKKDSREEVIAKMRENIGLRMISADVIDPRSGRPQKATIAFNVSYTSPSPESAYRVASELTTLYLNENLTSRARLAQEAFGFLNDEADRLGKEVDEVEAKLSTFKQANTDALPEQSQLNLQLLDRTEQELQTAATRLSSLDQTKAYLESQLALSRPNSAIFSDTGERILSAADRLKMAKSQLAAAQGAYGEAHPDVVRLRAQIESLQKEAGESPQDTNDLARRLQDAEAKLAAARKQYSAEHPDVLLLTRVVAEIRTAMEAARKTPELADRLNAAARGEVGGGKDEPADNPAYVQIQTQIKTTSYEREGVVANMAHLRAEIADYRRKISASPEVERQYRDLLRELENAQNKYREIRAKQMEATVAKNLESDRKGERFTLIEPPLPPEKAESPNRPLILALGFVFSLALAAGMAALLENLDITIRNSGDLLRLLPESPLALVPRIFTEREMRAARRRKWYGLTGALAGCVTAAVAVHMLYRPLDILWVTALRRFGV